MDDLYERHVDWFELLPVEDSIEDERVLVFDRLGPCFFAECTTGGPVSKDGLCRECDY